MDLDEYQRLSAATDQRPGREDDALVFPMIGLASEVGGLVNQYKKRIRDGEAHALFSDRVAEELGDILWYLANVATKLDLSLDEIASLNLRRIRERWPSETSEQPPQLLDESWPENEQIPRHATIIFSETLEEGRPRVHLSCDGEQIGDPLSDMAKSDDAYRYHDAFHLSYAALLGWSPISRSFFDRKRRSNPITSEVEDSGRAKVIEEAIAVLAFEYARTARFLEGVHTLDFTLLQTIHNLVSGLEVRIRTTREWETAIIRSFEIWRQLRANKGGVVTINLPDRDIVYSPPA